MFQIHRTRDKQLKPSNITTFVVHTIESPKFHDTYILRYIVRDFSSHTYKEQKLTNPFKLIIT